MNFLSTATRDERLRIDRAKESRSRRTRSTSDQHDKQQSGEGDSEDAAPSSPWTGVGSPSSSDFETISDSELQLNPPPPHAPIRPSSLSHTLARRNSSTNSAATMSDSGSSTPETRPVQQQPPRGRLSHQPDSEGGGDGDDEESANDDEMRGRGRGRTRRREEDPAMRRSMLEDALRSSLATLLSLSSTHAALSPAMSSANLTSLFSAQSPLGATSPRPFPPTVNRPSSFAFALSQPVDEQELGRDQAQDASEWNEDDQSLSEEAIDFYSGKSSSDEGTQLGPRSSQYKTSSSTRAIPIPSSSRVRERSMSDSLPNDSEPFSPIQSRPLALAPSSASPPVWSRRRRRRGQRYSSMSPAPAPASLEERRRARARGTTDAEESGVEPDQEFQDLVDSAKTFMTMPRRLSGGSGSTNIPATTDDTAPLPSLATSRLFSSALGGHISPRPIPPSQNAWDHAPPSPSSSFPSSDPYPASAPATVDLSSGPDELSPTRKAVKPRNEEKAERSLSAGAGSSSGGGGGWLAWLTRTVEIRVWQLVLLVGVGVGAGSLAFKYTTKVGRLSMPLLV